MDSRKRNIKSMNQTSNDGQQKQPDATHDLKKLAGAQPGGEYVIVCLILLGAALAGLAHYTMESYLPLPEDRQIHRMDFDYRKAREHLVSLTDFGPRVVGSVENEVLAPKYILEQLEKIQSNYLNKQLFEMQFEVFRTEGGSFALNFLHEYISVYRNIASVVLRILPKQVTPESAFLINCHYDTVADSPGAGDDTASCALMLEMARAAVSSDQPLQNALVFLWNGAEENMLQASHAFVAQHRWFTGPPRIAAFVNLDAAGSSGREIAFQIGPENPWLIEAYAKTVRHAWASISAQEFFECEIVPGVSDYRQFRDTGRLPGVDVAFIQNGYIYHTQFDTADRIADASLHRAGTNMLALIREVANSSLLANPGAQRHGKVVFYDILGIFMVVYPKSVGTVINLLLCLLIVIVAIRPKLKNGFLTGSSAKPHASYSSLVVKMMLVIVFKIVMTFVVAITIGLIVSRIARHSMSWYSHVWPVFGYLGPIFAVQFAVTAYTRSRMFRSESQARLEMVHFDAFQLLVVLITVALTLPQLGSAYLPMIFGLNSFVIRNLLYERILIPRYNAWIQRAKVSRSDGLQTDDKNRPAESRCPEIPLGVLFAVNFTSFALALTQSAYMNRGLAALLLPILGRSGSEPNTEVVFASMISFFTIWSLLSQSSILYRVRLDRAIALCCLLFASVLAALCFTDLGFPFSVNPHTQDAFLKRVFLSHTSRVLIRDDKLVENKTSLWVTSLDPEGIDVISSYLKASQVDVDHGLLLECETEFWPYCGLPMIYPVATLMKRQYILPIPQEFYTHRKFPELKLIEKMESPQSDMGARVRLVFECHNIPSHMSLSVANRIGVQFVRWTYWTHQEPEVYENPREAYFSSSLDEETGILYRRSHYFTYYAYGTAPREPFRFAVDFVVNSDRHGRVPLAEIALGATYMHKPDAETVFQQKLRPNFPEWVNDVMWSTHYDARTYFAMLT